MTQPLSGTADTFTTARPRLPSITRRPPLSVKGAVASRTTLSSRLFSGSSRQTSFVVPQLRDCRIRQEAFAGNGRNVVHAARPEQLPDHESRAARGLKLVHIRLAVWIHPRQQRYRRREVGKVGPVDDNSRCAGDGDPVNQMVGRAARCQQRHHGVDDACLRPPPRRRERSARLPRRARTVRTASRVSASRTGAPGCIKALPGTCSPIASRSI